MPCQFFPDLNKYTYQVCDLPIDHPSCSKQHAAFQYRLVTKKKDDGSDANRYEHSRTFKYQLIKMIHF